MIITTDGSRTPALECMQVPSEQLCALEQFEGAAWEDLYRAAPAALRERHGLRTRRAACATLLMAPGLDVLAFNRATGLGLEGPADRRAIGWIGEAFVAAGVRRYFVPVSPLAEPSALPSWLRAHGLRPYNRWVKLIRGVEEAAMPETRLRIERVSEEHAGDFGRIVSAAFEWPAWVGEWIAATIGRRGWLHYLAFDGRTPVAAATLRHAGPFGWPAWAATLPEYRGQGAHAALLARRIQDARTVGCTILTAETAENRPERPSASNRNAIRAGFLAAYLRPNYLFDSESACLRE